MSVGTKLPPLPAPPTSVQPQTPPRRRRFGPLLAIAGIALLAAILIAMDLAVGVGQAGPEVRNVAAFRAVQLDGSSDVTIRVGDGQQVTVRGDAAVVERLDTVVRDGTLVISRRGWFGPSRPTAVDITVPELDGVTLRGSGTIIADRVDSESFAVALPGSGTIELRGTAGAVDVVLAGSGAVRLSGLVTRNATVTVAGSGDVRVHATDRLRATITGSGSVRYSGDPETVEDSVTGSGTVGPEHRS